MENFRFDHTLECSLRAREDATLAADRERLGPLRSLTRDSTGAELELLEAFGQPSIDAAPFTAPGDPTPVAEYPKTEVVRFTDDILRRRVAGFDPDEETADE